MIGTIDGQQPIRSVKIDDYDQLRKWNNEIPGYQFFCRL